MDFRSYKKFQPGMIGHQRLFTAESRFAGALTCRARKAQPNQIHQPSKLTITNF
jgi:flagellum-specific peptidoglycan hydrolase FlgJ